MHYRTDYHSAALDQAPRSLRLGPWHLQYLAFARQADDPRPPVLLLGGAFQRFRAFSGEVATLLDEHPVILLDLPSQGGNLQLAPELSLAHLADLIGLFAERLQLPALMPIGLSYGSALAALFAVRHPQRCARLLLCGISTCARDGARRLLEEGLALLAEGEVQRFAQGALTGLLNPLQQAATGVPTGFRRALLRQLLRLSPHEVERYRQNTQRLLDFPGFTQHPQCPTLLLVGEHDHFTQPWEHARFAAACADADCVLIHHADHLAQFERPAACADLYRPFLNGQPLPRTAPGSTRLPRRQWLTLDKRHGPRRAPLNPGARLRHAAGGDCAAQVLELGFFGGRLRADWPADWPARGWQLLLPDGPALALLPLRRYDQTLSFVFTHTDADASAALAAALAVALQPDEVASACA
ncbi:MAG: alpha/beta hydrolase [Pseudomonas sp.]|uniref:alpha/beta fold hydrolase n=1 Tax=Pseudomonas sp. TaxID=306 RepID=UPI003393B89F